MKNTTRKPSKASAISEEDVLIGLRIRHARIESGHTQTTLAKIFDISSQQVQKFEFGYNRVTAKNLYKMSRLFDKPMEWFTQDIDGKSNYKSELKDSTFSLKMLRYFDDIDCRKKQVKAFKLIRMFLDEAR